MLKIKHFVTFVILNPFLIKFILISKGNWFFQVVAVELLIIEIISIACIVVFTADPNQLRALNKRLGLIKEEE